MKILSINVAHVADLFAEQSGNRHQVKSGIYKRSVAGAVTVQRLGLAGDEQADLSVHGGLDKAVYAYASEHYSFWQAQRDASLKRSTHALQLAPGSLGENLTLEGILEADVWIGDRLHAGSTVLQVTEPRHPCFKLNAALSFSHAAKAMIQSGFSGFYLRVVQPGSIAAGDVVQLVPGPREVALAWLNERRSKGRQSDLF